MTPGATVTPMACNIDTLENASRPKPATVVRLANSIEANVLGETVLGETVLGKMVLSICFGSVIAVVSGGIA